MNPATTAVPIVLCAGAVREVKTLKEHLVAMGVTVVLKTFSRKSSLNTSGRC